MSEPIKKSTVVNIQNKTYNNTTQVQSIFPAKLRYTGATSGKEYIWEKAGDVVSVENVDLDELLTKKVGSKGCCGDNLNGNPVFQIFK